MINLDISDGILVHDVDAEVETTASEETTAIGQIDDVADEVSRKSLRDQLRRTLSKKEHTGISLFCPDISVCEHVPDLPSHKSTVSVVPEVPTDVGLSFKPVVDFISL